MCFCFIYEANENQMSEFDLAHVIHKGFHLKKEGSNKLPFRQMTT